MLSLSRIVRAQEKLAELPGIHENHVRRIEGGSANPSFVVLVKLANALRVPPSQLFSDSN
jgi:transcriptional regulator with XRE-family HTH domain